MRFAVERIDHIVLNVRHVEATAAWYERVLGMQRESFGADKRIALKFGNQKINLRPLDADPSWVTGTCDRPGAGDLCFITTVAPNEVVAHLRSHGVAIVDGPVERQGALGRMRSVYCRDPDGNLVELATYEAP